MQNGKRMMNRCFKAVLLPLVMLCVGVCAEIPLHDFSNGLNIKEFGAKGDGVTDDTEAIQRALQYVHSLSRNLLLASQPTVDDLPQFANEKALGSNSDNVVAPEIFFPSGRYLVRRTLIGGSLYLRGEEGSVIVMEDSEKDILYLHWGYRLRLTHLTFE